MRAQCDCVLFKVERAALASLALEERSMFYRLLTVLLAYRFRLAVGQEEQQDPSPATNQALELKATSDYWVFEGKRVRSVVEVIRSPVEEIKDRLYKLKRKEKRQHSISEGDVHSLMDDLGKVFAQIYEALKTSGRNPEHIEVEQLALA